MTSSHPESARRSLLADPLQAVSATIMAVMTTAVLNQLSVWFAPLLLMVCLGGLVVVTLGRLRAERIRKLGEQTVDYQKLAATDTDQLLPWLK
ncbi:MAG TPA: hypothetical protein VHV08_17155, partial [Pirellulales bacterium]|nr:hypothetical protein [Pirellulales bacterium]